MIPKRTNPPMPEQPLTRTLRPSYGFMEGEDFKCKCPYWCVPLQPGAFPQEEGWYLAVSHFSGAEVPVPTVEPVYVCQSTQSEDGWVVHEAGGDPTRPAERGSFWWVGKIKLPNCKDLRAK